jgi:hypothetical protein
MNSNSDAANNNRQESHRIYLQLFTPQSSASAGNVPTTLPPQLHRHDSHQIHTPNYPMTTPGAPYRFPSTASSDSQASFSFSSSLSSAHPVGRGPPQKPTSSAAAVGNKPTKQRFIQQPSTITTSAVIRLTDRALAKDVTALLRGKFGLPQQVTADEGRHHSQYHKSPQRERELSFGQSFTSSLARRLSPSSTKKHQKVTRSDSESGSDGRQSSNFSTLDSDYPYHDQHQTPIVVDALVLVGTLEGPPKGFVSFEHEEDFELCEQTRLWWFARELSYRRQLQQQQEWQVEAYQQQRQQQLQRKLEKLDEEKEGEINTFETNISNMFATIPVSESSVTVRASGNTAKGYYHHQFSSSSSSSSSSSLALSPGKSHESMGLLDLSSSRDGGKMGLDLSSSQYSSVGGGNRVGNESSLWRAGVGGVIVEGDGGGGGGGKTLTSLFSDLSLTAATSSVTLDAGMQISSPIQYEPDFEQPIHIIRTVHPEEHPLQVRDEMMKSLSRLRLKAEEQMGLGLSSKTNVSSYGKSGGRRQQPQLTFRWYFQPCSPLGGIDASASPSPKIQSIPAYIDVEGYCTDDDKQPDDNSNGEGFDDEYDDNMSYEDGNAEDQNNHVGSFTDKISVTTQIRRLNKEKQRIAMLRELSDSPFTVSGYLLKQSQKDPNVWKRVYCVLSDDRLWVIGRVKPLTELCGNNVGRSSNHDAVSSLRVGRHFYINLHRSILIEREEPLNHRLPNTFRVVTSLGNTHSFRAFNSQTFRSWTVALSEKIMQTHTGGILDLAHVIAEEETFARCRRMEDIAVTPFLTNMSASREIPPLSMDIVRFGISVAEYRELCRKVYEAMQLYKNSGGVVNVQTRVGGSPNSKANKASLSNLSVCQSARNEAMVSSVWEDARVVASKSAQLLHALATSQHSILETNTHEDEGEGGDADAEEENSQSSFQISNHSMKDLIDEQKDIQKLLSKRWTHQQVTREAYSQSDDGEMDHLPPLKLFDNLLKQLHCSVVPNVSHL